MKLILCLYFISCWVVSTCAFNAYFIKTATPFAIDGNASDWAGIKTTHPITNIQLQILGTFKAAYDSNNVYFYLEVTDGSKLLNAASLENFQQAIYAGDGASICFGPFNGQGTNQRIVFTKVRDGETIFVMRPEWSDSSSHPFDYYTTASGDFHVDYEWYLQQEGGQVYVNETSTGGGWWAEVLIPWSSLLYTPQDNDFIPFDFEILVADPSGTTISEAAWWYSKGAATATEDIVAQARLYPTEWGQAQLSPIDVGPQNPITPPVDPAFIPRGIPISFYIPSSEGVAVTVNIVDSETGWVYQELVRAQPMAKGNHTIYWNGFDRENKPVPAGNYQAVIAYYPPLTTTFAGSVGNSGSPPFPTSDGKGAFGGVHYGPSSVAGDSSGLYLLHTIEEGIGGVRKINPVTGETYWVAGMGIFVFSNTMAVEDDILAITSFTNGLFYLTVFNATTGVQISTLPKIGDGTVGQNASGLALLNGTAYISNEGVVQIATETPHRQWDQSNFTVNGMTGLCRFNITHLVLVTSSSLSLYDVTTGTSSSVASGLESATVCTTNTDNGDIFVSTTVQVLRYNIDGQLVQTIGEEGGRPNTVRQYSPYQLQNVMYMAFGPDGNLYLAERAVAPFRFAVFTIDGEWVRDYYGPIGYELVIVDYDDTSTVYYVNEAPHPWLIQAKVNYTAYANNASDSWHGFSIEAIYLFTQNGVNFSASPDLMVDEDWAAVGNGYGGGGVFIGNNGIKYMFLGQHFRVACALLVWDTETLLWRPTAILRTSTGLGIEGWFDLNHNGLVDANEYIPLPAVLANQNFYFCTRDLVLHTQRFSFVPGSIDEFGLPRYDTGSVLDWFYSDTLSWEVYIAEGREAEGVFAAPSTSENATYIALSFGLCGDQTFWDRSSGARIAKIANGKIQWAVGHKNAAMAENGDTTMLFAVAGEVDGVVCVGEILSNFECYSADGLSLGWLLKDAAGDSAQVGYNAITVENAAQAVFIKDTTTGLPTLFSMTTGDLRILRVTGPFGDNITRTYQDITLSNPWPRQPSAQPRVYDLAYITQGDGSDGYFYNYVPYADGYDWEWRSTVSAITIQSSNETVAEARARRDAGELLVFADVFALPSQFPFFPLNSSVANTSNPVTLFGTATGLEVLIGSTPDSRTSAGLGDTRIFLTAYFTPETGAYTGFAFAIRPTSPPVNATYLRSQNTYGNYTGPTPSGVVDFSSLEIIPGAAVGVLPRLDKLGYRIEASIPLGVLPELTSLQEISFLRYSHSSPTGTVSATYSDIRPDFEPSSLPLGFNVAVYLPTGNGSPQRVPWVQDGFTGTDPSVMNPSLWGVVEPPAKVLLYTISPSSTLLSYVTTTPTAVPDSNIPTYTPSPNTLVAGSWFGPSYMNANQPVEFVSTNFTEGFSISYTGGLGYYTAYWPQHPDWRLLPYFDGSALNLPFSKDVSGGGHPNDILTITVQTSFIGGGTGILHVLWGEWTADTNTDCYLNITDITHGIVISGEDQQYENDLSFPNTYHQLSTETRETTVIIGGTSTFLVSLTNRANSGDVGAYISAVWIEPVVTPSFTSPSNVTLLCQVVNTASAPADHITLYDTSNNALIGVITPNEPLIWMDVQAGQYQVTAVAVDKFGGQSNSSSLSVNVYGPFVAPLSPVNGDTIQNPVTLTYQVSEFGTSGTIEAVQIALSTGATYKLTNAPWTVNAGSLPFNQLITATVTAVDSAGYFSSLKYSFSVSSSFSSPSSSSSGGRKITIS